MSVYTFVFCPKNLLKKVDKNIPPVEFRSMLLKFDKYFLRLKRSSYENNAKKKAKVLENMSFKQTTSDKIHEKIIKK